MTRELKFRAWVVNQYGDWMAQQGVHEEIDTPAKFLALYGNSILMQYTGLKDKNGKEIYEGDICIYHGLEEHRVVVVWDTIGFAFEDTATKHLMEWPRYDGRIMSGYYDRGRFEVIGNVHENPELLEAKS
jgi:uncharacterized phage protein (TIGR01671 family)